MEQKGPTEDSYTRFVLDIDPILQSSGLFSMTIARIETSAHTSVSFALSAHISLPGSKYIARRAEENRIDRCCWLLATLPVRIEYVHPWYGLAT